MSSPKTRPTEVDVQKFLDELGRPEQQADSTILLRMMGEATGDSPTMWGPTIIGFGQFHYRYASGRTGEWFKVGFSPRKKAFSLYLAGGLDHHKEALTKLGRHTRGKSCLYIKRLDDVNLEVLEKMIQKACSVATGLCATEAAS
ncbi:MAG: DUF1801 domain-containing protein [Rhodothermaceae bacterium]|nr:DUF1801 domain-containing protein [Rhodothermaceae bacterium]MYD18286.1 DUF1801 domain-containing protein [Rhodothermaceae bacterium]MYI43653.1 DUF1801 domain-containing protein [Rhodothermaceae bacterium]MYJ57258.1 DUF1801 domain-containing protein [Rhodothermaceae bacterium]